MARNIIVYTSNQGTNREKYFNHNIYQRERMPSLAGNKQLSVHFFPHGPRLLHPSTEKVRVRSVGNGHQCGYSRADTKNKSINKRSKLFPYREKILKCTEKLSENIEKNVYSTKRFMITCFIN